MKSLQESLLDDDDVLISNQDNFVIEQFLNENYIISGKYTIEFDKKEKHIAIVNVLGDVFFKNKDLETLTGDLFTFGEVTGKFYCDQRNTYESKLKNLKGAPKIVGDLFDCSTCLNLITLEGAPEYCKDFQCKRCRKLTNLKGGPLRCDDFCCDECDSLQSLEGAPKDLNNFSCMSCHKLKDLKGAPKRVWDRFDCRCCLNLKSITGCPKNCRIFSCPGIGKKFTEEEVQALCKADYIYV